MFLRQGGREATLSASLSLYQRLPPLAAALWALAAKLPLATVPPLERAAAAWMRAAALWVIGTAGATGMEVFEVMSFPSVGHVPKAARPHRLEADRRGHDTVPKDFLEFSRARPGQTRWLAETHGDAPALSRSSASAPRFDSHDGQRVCRATLGLPKLWLPY